MSDAIFTGDTTHPATGQPPVPGEAAASTGVSDNELVDLTDSGNPPFAATERPQAAVDGVPDAPPGYRLIPNRKPGTKVVRNVQYIIAGEPMHTKGMCSVLWTGKSLRAAQAQLDNLGGAIYGAFRNVRVLRCKDVTEECK